MALVTSCHKSSLLSRQRNACRVFRRKKNRGRGKTTGLSVETALPRTPVPCARFPLALQPFVRALAFREFFIKASNWCSKLLILIDLNLHFDFAFTYTQVWHIVFASESCVACVTLRLSVILAIKRDPSPTWHR